jgi:hypothetical protein
MDFAECPRYDAEKRGGMRHHAALDGSPYLDESGHMVQFGLD